MPAKQDKINLDLDIIDTDRQHWDLGNLHDDVLTLTAADRILSKWPDGVDISWFGTAAEFNWINDDGTFTLEPGATGTIGVVLGEIFELSISFVDISRRGKLKITIVKKYDGHKLQFETVDTPTSDGTHLIIS